MSAASLGTAAAGANMVAAETDEREKRAISVGTHMLIVCEDGICGIISDELYDQ
jgi:hypothetical protein